MREKERRVRERKGERGRRIKGKYLLIRKWLWKDCWMEWDGVWVGSTACQQVECNQLHKLFHEENLLFKQSTANCIHRHPQQQSILLGGGGLTPSISCDITVGTEDESCLQYIKQR